jgi:hypothetical protein
MDVHDDHPNSSHGVANLRAWGDARLQPFAFGSSNDLRRDAKVMAEPHESKQAANRAGRCDRSPDRTRLLAVPLRSPPAAPNAVAAASRSQGSVARLLCRVGGIDSLSAIYPDHQFWNVILPKYLQRGTAARVIEIGSAPGDNLVEINHRFGFEPFGVEYTPTGAQESRQTISAAGFPDHLFECDAFFRRIFSSVTGHL